MIDTVPKVSPSTASMSEQATPGSYGGSAFSTPAPAGYTPHSIISPYPGASRRLPWAVLPGLEHKSRSILNEDGNKTCKSDLKTVAGRIAEENPSRIIPFFIPQVTGPFASTSTGARNSSLRCVSADGLQSRA